MGETVIIGSGIGGAGIAALRHQKGEATLVLEKEAYPGGCAGTFTRKGLAYNAGATTLAGFGRGLPVAELFNRAGRALPDIVPTDPGIIVKIGGKTIRRFRDVERFIDEINTHWPHPAHRPFWRTVHAICDRFYAMGPVYYAKNRPADWLKTLASLLPIALRFNTLLLRNGLAYLEALYGELPGEYRAFLDSQVLIAAQARCHEVGVVVMALSLGYTFFENGYVTGGMGQAVEMLLGTTPVRYGAGARSIKREWNGWRVATEKETFTCEKLVLGTSLFEKTIRFEDADVAAFAAAQAARYNLTQGAFMVYGTFVGGGVENTHYQVILPKQLPGCISDSLFFSPGHTDDPAMAAGGRRTFTLSVHTDVAYWKRLEKPAYREAKLATGEAILVALKAAFPGLVLHDAFYGTPKSFARYTGRWSVGGIPLTRANFTPRFPAPDTPFAGLYRTGDTVFAGQGWIGVSLGVMNLDNVMGR